MKTKLIILAILIIVLGGGWYYYKNTKVGGNEWYVYKSEKLGLSIELPKMVWGPKNCSNNQEESGLVPLVVLEGEGSVYFTPEKMFVGDSEHCVIQNTNIERIEMSAPPTHWKITSIKVSDEVELNKLIAKISNQYEARKGCRLVGVYNDDFYTGLQDDYWVNVADENGMTGPESFCFTFPQMFYSKTAGRVFYWWNGQGPVFLGNSFNLATEDEFYDGKIRDSLRFLK